MSSRPAFVVDWGRMVRLLMIGAAAWFPAMIGLFLHGLGVIPFALSVGLGFAGSLAALVMVASRTIKRRRKPLATVTHAASLGKPIWSQVANPRANHANRWAMYDDLSAWLAKQDWSGKRVGEFGGSNDILRAFMPVAEYRLMQYPEYDLQNLHGIADDIFDLVILDQTLEHLPQPERALAEVRRVLKRGGAAIVTTPFLVPVHQGTGYGDYYRWTPDGLALTLQRAGFDAEVRMWGNRRAAAALLDDMYMSADTALRRGITVSSEGTEADFPITVWALAVARKD
jgi:SAM-dependent methyltransferase